MSGHRSRRSGTIRRAEWLTSVFAIALTGSAVLSGGSERVDATEFHVALVSASDQNPPPGDDAVIEHLEAGGKVVTVVDDDSLGDVDPSRFDVIAISSTVTASKVGQTFTTTSVPVLVWEHYLYDDLGLIGNGRGMTAPSTDVEIVHDDHPLAGGLTGTVSVTTARQRSTWGEPTPEAQVVAVDPASDRAVVFAYEAGAALRSGIAPARRVAFHLSPRSAIDWSDDGKALFDAALAWSGGLSTDPSNQPPDVDAGSDVTVDTTTIDLAGTVVDDGEPLGTLSSRWTGPTGVTFADAADPTTSVTLPGDGAYELTLTADDGELQSRDSLVVTVDTSPPPTGRTVVWVTGSANPPWGDEVGIDRLSDAGFEVVVVDDNDATVVDADEASLVVITSSVNPRRVDHGFADINVPLLIWEPTLYDDFGFVATTDDRGQTSTTRRITITNDSHPLAGGLSGEVELFVQSKPLSWGAPPDEAMTIATDASDASRAVLFAYEDGATMVDRVAPARRVAFPLSYSGPRPLTTDGLTLWDAAIEWLLDSTIEPGEDPVASFVVAPQSGEAPLHVSFDASASTDPDGDIDVYTWDFGDGGTATGITVEHRYLSAGSYDVVLEVTDQTGRSSTDTATVTVSGAWEFPDHHFRVPLTAQAVPFDRTDAPVVVDLDVTSLFSDLGADEATFDPASLRVSEVDGDGNTIDPFVPFQFDRAPRFEPTTAAVGELVVVLRGATPAGTERTFDVYLDTAGQGHSAADPSPLVSVDATGTDQGLAAYVVTTANATWSFDPRGGGILEPRRLRRQRLDLVQ